MEREAGAYALIPEFRDFMKSQKKEMVPEDMTPSDLYTNDTLFRFYSRSASKPKPGKGKGERLGAEGGGSYTELAKIQDWRKMLSNFWAAPFTLDGKRWNSVEHYYQASKFKKEHPKPWDKGSGFKSPKMSDPKYFQKNTKLVDFKLYDEAKAKYEKKEGEHEKIYREKLREWKYKERAYFSNDNKKRDSLDKKIKETQYELPRRIYSLVDKKFILLTLKDKSNIELYIDIYTGCEKLYNKTPSAFLLEWQS